MNQFGLFFILFTILSHIPASFGTFRNLGEVMRLRGGTDEEHENSKTARGFLSRIDEDNNEAFKILTQINHIKDGWQHVATTDGIRVERRALPAGRFVDPIDAAKGSKHACVKSTGLIDATPEAVFRLFLDNSRVREYNEHCLLIKDVMYLPKTSDKSWSKIAWASGPKYGPLKARDFVSVVSFFRFDNGTNVIMNRPAYHDDYPPSKEYVRATILLAGNIIEPHGRNQTKLTMIAHINPGGGADTTFIAWMINKMCAVEPPNFMRKLEEAAQASLYHHEEGGSFLGISPLRIAKQLQRNFDKFNSEVQSLVQKILPPNQDSSSSGSNNNNLCRGQKKSGGGSTAGDIVLSKLFSSSPKLWPR